MTQIKAKLPDFYLSHLAFLEDCLFFGQATKIRDVYVNECGHLTKGGLCNECSKG